MSYQNFKISKPVSIYDIQRAVASSNTGIDRLIKEGNINKWARYKPERRAGITMMTHAQRKANHFGLNVPYCRQAVMNAMVYGIMNGDIDTAWEYLRPQGGSTGEAYRFTDFVRDLKDTTDPFYGTVYAPGYFVNAKLPFERAINMSGITKQYDSTLDMYYFEINLQVSSVLEITMFNAIGDDIHLQDLIDIPSVYPSDRQWRPVIQVFDGFKRAGEEEWYNRSQPDFSVAGDPITTSQYAQIKVTLDLNDSHFQQYVGVNEYLHTCIGIGRCDATAQYWYEPDGPLFILPFTNDDPVLPSYIPFKLVSYSARRLKVIGLQWFNSSGTWVADTSQSYYTITKAQLGGTQIRLTLTISKLEDQQIDFIPENGTPDAGYDQLKIQAREMIGGGEEEIKYLEPRTSGWQIPNPNHTHIGTGVPSETQEIYATMYIGDIPAGGYGEYHLWANTGSAQWNEIGYFSIHMI
jgi:hypothetical protein